MHLAAIPKSVRLWPGWRTKQRIPMDEHLWRLLGKELLEPCACVCDSSQSVRFLNNHVGMLRQY